jgi:hypothetical protein
VSGQSLDEAWKAAEAALPKGWDNLTLWWHPDRSTAMAVGPNTSEDLYHPRREEVRVHADTPTAALQALAARLSEIAR